MEDFTVVAGAGIWGCTVAWRLADSGRRVLVLEERSGVGGNVRCETDPESGIEIHTYGSHIFHTHNDAAWRFVRRFTEFNGYQHKVLARYRGKTYFLPLGLTLVNKFFGVELTPEELPAFMDDPAHAQAVFDAFFRGYTSKQWGRPPEEIDPTIIKRVPVRSSYDVNYFNDYNQGIPSAGYNALFERLLDHPNIKVKCNTAFSLEGVGDWSAAGAVYYSGPIDRLFDYKFGALPWRSLRFEVEKLPIRDFQGTSVVNYTEAEVPYTRIHEFKHYHPEQKAVMECPKTVIMREYPKTWQLGDEPYYPVNTPESQALLEQYRMEVERYNQTAQTGHRPRLVVGGRLGEYKYYDMDQSIAKALELEL